MRAAAMFCLLLLAWAHPAPPLVLGQSLVPPQHHEWAKFRPGAWKHVRITREDLDGRGNVISTSVTETTTTLISASEQAVTLRVDTIVEVAGRQFAKQPQLVKQGLGGELDGQTVPAKTVGTQSIKIDGKAHDSEIRTATCNSSSWQWTSRVYYCKNTAPYVLRRETSSTDMVNAAAKFETQAEVIAIDQPIEVKGVMKKGSQIRTVHTTAKTTTTTLEFRCEDVPGGFVSHKSEQVDSAGHVVGRSTLELVDYYVPSSDGRARVEYRQVWPRWYYRRWGR